MVICLKFPYRCSAPSSRWDVVYVASHLLVSSVCRYDSDTANIFVATFVHVLQENFLQENTCRIHSWKQGL